jgi:hypothetical protein
MSRTALSRCLAIRVEAVQADGYRITMSEHTQPPRYVVQHPSGMTFQTTGSSVDDAVSRALTRLRRQTSQRSP